MSACDCTSTLQYMAKRGARHAMRMLALGLHESKWAKHDFPIHFREENYFFFPYIPTQVADRLRADHVVFLTEIKKYGRIISITLFAQHATIENHWAKQLMRAA